MRKQEMDKMMEEFLAKDGKIVIVPPHVEEEPTHIVPVKNVIDHDILSLGESELYFGETRKRKSSKTKKKVSNDDFKHMVENSKLPSSIIEALKRNISSKG